jgi:hypothetical protein
LTILLYPRIEERSRIPNGTNRFHTQERFFTIRNQTLYKTYTQAFFQLQVVVFQDRKNEKDAKDRFLVLHLQWKYYSCTKSVTALKLLLQKHFE